MHRPARALSPAAVLVALTLGACNTNSYSATCDTDHTCTIEISGNAFHEFPRPYDASEGIEPDGGTKDRIRLVSATEGGEATIQAGGRDNTCTEGESFRAVDTTITCEVIGEDRVELSSTRS